MTDAYTITADYPSRQWLLSRPNHPLAVVVMPVAWSTSQLTEDDMDAIGEAFEQALNSLYRIYEEDDDPTGLRPDRSGGQETG